MTFVEILTKLRMCSYKGLRDKDGNCRLCKDKNLDNAGELLGDFQGAWYLHTFIHLKELTEELSEKLSRLTPIELNELDEKIAAKVKK